MTNKLRTSSTFRRTHLLQRVSERISSDPFTNSLKWCIRRNVGEVLFVICSRHPFVSLIKTILRPSEARKSVRTNSSKVRKWVPYETV